MAWIEKDYNDHLVSTPCYVQGCQQLDQAAQSHIQPGLECLQGWASTTSLGNLFQCVTTLWVKNFLLISNLNLSCLSLNPFLLVLSWSTLVNSHTLSCLYAPFQYWNIGILMCHLNPNLFSWLIEKRVRPKYWAAADHHLTKTWHEGHVKDWYVYTGHELFSIDCSSFH